MTIYADRVKETTIVTSTATITLLGAADSWLPFSAIPGIASGATGIPVCVGPDADGQWEIGSYTYTDATHLTREGILSSSNDGAAVTFAAGSKSVYATISATQLSKLVSVAASVVEAVTDTAVATVIIEEGGVAKRITFDNFVAAVGVAASNLSAAGALSGADILAISQGGTEVRTTLSALQTFIGVAPSAATAVTMTGPTAGTVSVASTNFTVGANGTIAGTVVVTPSDGGAGGTFTPTTVSLTSGSPTGTFTYTPASAGAKTISVTNNGSLTNPSNITYTASASAATAIAVSGPSSGATGAASTNFTASANGVITGTVVVTPSDGGGGGTFTPTTVSISSGTPTATFTYTPGSTGAKTLSFTNNGGLTNPGNITYTSNAASYTITGYGGNAPKATIDASVPDATYGSLKQIIPAKQGTNTGYPDYWTITPESASAIAGWGTSNTVPPAEITLAANASAGTSINGMAPMAHGAGTTTYRNQTNLWLTVGSGNGGAALWYFWVKPVNGVAVCMNPSGTTVTGA